MMERSSIRLKKGLELRHSSQLFFPFASQKDRKADTPREKKTTGKMKDISVEGCEFVILPACVGE